MLSPAAACVGFVDLCESSISRSRLCGGATRRGSGRTCKLGGLGFGIPRAGQAVLARSVESTDLMPACVRPAS